jgi:hypothetical protein
MESILGSDAFSYIFNNQQRFQKVMDKKRMDEAVVA